jgi:hypothetical protein
MCNAQAHFRYGPKAEVILSEEAGMTNQFRLCLRISSEIESATVCGVCCRAALSGGAGSMGTPSGTSVRGK